MSIRPIQGARERRAVDLSALSAVAVRPLDDRPLSPWLVEPAGDVDLALWAREAGAPKIERLLLERGAVVLRGFGLRTAAEFEAVAEALTADLYGGYGDLPREGESANIYKSTPYPADQPILFHSESAHLSSWPMRLSFFCITPSADGGETPLADTKAILAALGGDVAAEFEAKGLLYTRNFSGLDVSWQQFFQTEEHSAVEARCRAEGTEFAWLEGGQRLRVRQPTPAVRAHPVTGEPLFFNQIQLHHPYYLQPEVRDSLRQLVDGDDDLPRNVTFGDGTPISDEVAEHVLQTYWDTCVMFPWRQGDIIALDNMRIAHARMPFTGARRIAVAMAGMTSG